MWLAFTVVCVLALLAFAWLVRFGGKADVVSAPPSRRSVDPSCFSAACIFVRADADADECLTERELDALDADYLKLASRSRGAIGACWSGVAAHACVDAALVRDVWVPCRFGSL